MSVFAKVLRAGEGKKVRALAEVVPLINALEDEVSAMSDEELAHMTVEFRERLADGEDLERPARRGVRRGARGGTRARSDSATSTCS